MWVELPKHKASEKLQAELKTKISELRDEVEHEKKGGKKGAVSWKVPRRGPGKSSCWAAPTPARADS